MSKAAPARILHFTLGPVQEFIEQARRTRDFWAGSFILSLLSGHAMKALGGDRIIFPEISGDALFEALSNGGGGSPYVGSLPNRFKANIDKVEGDAGAICKKAVDDAWATICEAVWKHLFEHKDVHPDVQKRKKASRAIWDRQVLGFWDIAWVTGDEPDDHSDGSWLDLRKNFRTHMPTREGGDHCRLMGQYQEISGYHRIGERDKQQDFWRQLAPNHSTLDLRPDERLCAIALVKRFFPVVAEANGGIDGAMPFVPGGKPVSTHFWPSTSYIAALPWLKRVAKPPEDRRKALPDTAKRHLKSGYKSEKRTALYGLPADELFDLDGHLLHRDGIVSLTKEWLFTDEAARKAAAKALDAALVNLAETVGAPGKPVFASEFYAILRLDGDGIGKLLGVPGNDKHIKDALAPFTRSVGKFFDPKHNTSHGALIYAGGDDVLALLPVDTAICAAKALEAHYKDAFFKTPLKAEATISASILYSHFKNPLSAALRESARVLKKIAKDENGRASLALAVMKPGGLAAQWVSTFDHAVGELEQLARDDWGTQEDAGLSGGFFHGLRQNCEPLFTGADGKPGDFENEDMLESLVKAEMVNQFGGGAKRREAAGKLIGPVMAVLRPGKRNSASGTAPGAAFDGGLIVRFLRNERREAS